MKMMTDNEIIEAFKMHLLDNRDCELCPYGPAYYRWSIILLKDVLDLINRQQGEIEKLEKEIQDKERAYNDEFCLRKEWKTKCQELLKDKQTAKFEAVKEFADRLCDELRMYGIKDKFNKAVFLNVVDKVKKLVSESK